MRRSLYLLLLCAACQPPVERPQPQAVIVAAFDPTAQPPVVPLPNDLAFAGGDGVHLNVPDQPIDSPAQRRLNALLRTLDGFPTSSTASAQFSGPVDAAAVRTPSGSDPGSIAVVDLTTGQPLDQSAVAASVSPDGMTVLLTPLRRWPGGHRFAVVVYGGDDASGVRGLGGERVIASPAFFLLRTPRPLVFACPDAANPMCACSDPTLASCHSAVEGLDDAAAQAAEMQRRAFAPMLARLVPADRRVDNVVLFWTFVITTAPSTVFDPVRGEVPFPNDALIDPATGLVNLPIAPGDPQAAIKQQLDTLDGFSTSADLTTPIDLVAGQRIDAAGLVPQTSVMLLNLDPRPGAPQPELTVSQAPGGPITVTPIDALEPDQDRYALVITDAVTAGGAPLRPSPAMLLLTGNGTIAIEGHSTVAQLDDAQAVELEQLRRAYAPLLDRLGALGLGRDHVVSLSTFTTQSIARPLLALEAYPESARLPTDVTLTTVAGADVLAQKQAQLLFPTAHLSAIALGSFTSQVVIDPATGRVSFARTATQPGVPQADTFAVLAPAQPQLESLRFFISLPKTPASAAGAPVVILQHGLRSWRGQLILLADQFARSGWATIAFDAPSHGARSLCTDDAQCMGGCDHATGRCGAGFLPAALADDPLACTLEPLAGDPADCKPAASGAAFIDPGNLFRSRSFGQQYVLDAAQLVRVILDGANAKGLGARLAAQPGVPPIDRSRVAFLGYSLGGVLGTSFAAAAPVPNAYALVATGGHLFDIVTTGQAGAALVPALAAMGVQPGTPAFALLRSTATWILDPIDPFSVGAMVLQRPIDPPVQPVRPPQKHVLLVETGNDALFPLVFQDALARQLFSRSLLDAAGHAQLIGPDGTRSSFFSDANHGTLLSGVPAETAQAMRSLVLDFVTSSATAP